MKQDPKFGEYFNLPNPGLRAYFKRVEDGNADEYRTPFAKGESLQQLLQEWRKHLSKIKHKWPTLYAFEEDLGKKVGPMSIMLPLKDRMADIDHYYDDILLPSKPISKEAMDRSLREWKHVSRLRIRSQSKTVEAMKKSTNSGSPFFAKRRTVVSKTVPCSIESDDLDYIQQLPQSSWRTCAVLGRRGQEGGPSPADVKQRVVWMFPFAVNVRELQAYQPFKEAAQKYGIVPAWVSMEAVDDRITKMFDTKGPNDDVICTDFSKFDQHFNSVMQASALYQLDHLFAHNADWEIWRTEVFPIKYTIPLAYSYGKIRKGKHGMGSGSGGTNDDETLSHRSLQHESCVEHNTTLNPNSQCLGDDGVLTAPGLTVEDVIETYTARGLEMNPSKQYVSKHDCVYLRRWHHENYRVNGVCVGVYSTERALGRLAEQERYYDPDVWGAKAVCLRELSIIQNCCWHPLREEFADFCMTKDKYRLGIDIPGFLDNIEDIAKEYIELIPDFMGYTKALPYPENADMSHGISDWWIVKYLKSKR